jgi:hypothetical protein
MYSLDPHRSQVSTSNAGDFSQLMLHPVEVQVVIRAYELLSNMLAVVTVEPVDCNAVAATSVITVPVSRIATANVSPTSSVATNATIFAFSESLVFP